MLTPLPQRMINWLIADMVRIWHLLSTFFYLWGWTVKIAAKCGLPFLPLLYLVCPQNACLLFPSTMYIWKTHLAQGKWPTSYKQTWRPISWCPWFCSSVSEAVIIVVGQLFWKFIFLEWASRSRLREKYFCYLALPETIKLFLSPSDSCVYFSIGWNL